MANYTVSSKSNILTPSATANLDAAISAANRTITITPLPGYVVSKGDFSVNAGSITGVTAVTLSNTGDAYELGNKVELLVDFDASVNTITTSTFTLPISGDAILYTPVIEGADESIISDITFDLIDVADSGSTASFSVASGFSESNDTVSLTTATVTPGEPIVVGTYTVTASGGNQLPEVPELINIGGVTDYSQMDLSLDTRTVTTNADGNITGYTMDLIYTSMNRTQKEDQVKFEFKRSSKLLTSTAYVIENITNTDKIVNAKGGTINYKVYGTVGSKFKFKVVSSGGSNILAEDTYEVKQTGSFKKGLGYVSIDVDYPPATAKATYTLRITEVSSFGTLSSAIEGSSNSNNYFDYTINQYMDPIIKFNMSTSGLSNLGAGTLAHNTFTGKTDTDVSAIKNLSSVSSTFDIIWPINAAAGHHFTIVSGKDNFGISEFTYTEVTSANSVINVSNMSVVRSNNNTTATITGKGHILRFGKHTESDGIAEVTLNLNNILNVTSD